LLALQVKFSVALLSCEILLTIASIYGTSLPTFAVYLPAGNQTEAHDLLTETISISHEQKHNLGSGLFICCSTNLDFTSISFAPLTLN
jgi:hypothetical protein